MNRNTVNQDIFKAIHEGKWMSIEYVNSSKAITKYWIRIKDIHIPKRKIRVDGLHIGCYSMMEAWIFIDSIKSSKVLEGTYAPKNEALIEDIYCNPEKYKGIFNHIPNLKILNYYEMCYKSDATPYCLDYVLVKYLDQQRFENGNYPLSNEQFSFIVKHFQRKADIVQRESGDSEGYVSKGKTTLQQLGMNVLSFYTNKGLYVLAYRKLFLDVSNRVLKPSEDITICTEFGIEGVKESIRKFLDADDYELLEDFEKNQEKIKDCLMKNDRWHARVDDQPYLMGIGRDVMIDLRREYRGIEKMFEQDKVTYPIRSFFGDMLARTRRKKTYPFALMNDRVNLDQLLAINNAMRYPVAYVQGPPGTGKTSTILNTILTAFFNEKTVLFSSYNNHPINGVIDQLKNLKYEDRIIPFPLLRLGNNENIKETLSEMRRLYERCSKIKVYDKTLDKNKDERMERAKRLVDLLKQYEKKMELLERRETLDLLLDYEEKNQSATTLSFMTDLKDRQKNRIEQELEKAGTITDESALELLDRNFAAFYQYLYFVSAKYIKRIDEPKNEDLKAILNEEDEETRLKSFIQYLSKSDNIKKLKRIFPVMATTCLSAGKIGEPEPLFDMVIIDEASQCNTAVSLVPVIRGESLMLVGDPQQLNPVIVLDDKTNLYFRRQYKIPDEYDYKKNSIYKTFLMCDAVSDETLLHHHYRCDPRIIQFNNKKYYNSKLKIDSEIQKKDPLVFVDIKEKKKNRKKNESILEAGEIIRLANACPDLQIGVITPFVNQRKLIEECLAETALSNVTCGTVHAFQGDEKDVVIFSTAITGDTARSTYDWLKNNKELINVATSRARKQLIVLADYDSVNRLHGESPEGDDLFELIEYVKKKGMSVVTEKTNASRALGIKPFSSETESAFLNNLNHALQNILVSRNKYKVHKEIPISQVFQDNTTDSDLFYTGRFDFVVYERQGSMDYPVLAIELDGKEHFEDDVVRRRDAKKNRICEEHNLQLIRVENAYARRYYYIKEILMNYFSVRH